MKSRLVLVFMLLLTAQVHAQYNSEGNLTSRFRPGFMWFFTGYQPATPEKLRKYDRLIFDVTYNDWMGDRQPFKVHWSSIGFNTNLMFDIPMTSKNLASFGIGFCYGMQQMKHNEIVVIDSTHSYTQFHATAELPDVMKSSFVGHNFSVPIEFRFRTKGWKHFKVHIGGKIGYQLALTNKVRFDDGEDKYTMRYKSLPDVSRLTYSAHVRIGLRNWALFGSYNFNPLFKSNNSIQLNTFQMGLSVSLF